MSTENGHAAEETKAGHLPANKVGGRRVVNKKDQRNSESERAISESSDETKSILDTNLPAQLEKAYPPEAVRTYHEKPHPRHQPIQNAHVQQITRPVIQPRQFNHSKIPKA